MIDSRVAGRNQRASVSHASRSRLKNALVSLPPIGWLVVDFDFVDVVVPVVDFFFHC